MVGARGEAEMVICGVLESLFKATGINPKEVHQVIRIVTTIKIIIQIMRRAGLQPKEGLLRIICNTIIIMIIISIKYVCILLNSHGSSRSIPSC